METYYEAKPGLLKKSALALGFFDGVHPGHRAVIKCALEDARRLSVPAALVTFAEHPRSLTLGKSPPLLTLIEERLELFAVAGVDACLVLTFTEDICRLSPREYVENVLVKAMGARSISVGYNHHFGRNREGDPRLLEELGREFGFSVNVASPVLLDGLEVSSSRIREALEAGDVDLCARLLGRQFSVSGSVRHGDGRGRQIGFPTANLGVSEQQILPARGVYAAVANLPDGRRLPAVVNLGYRPTVTDGQTLATEVHVLDFSENLYGKNIVVEFWSFLRAERKFDSVEQLQEQISADCLTARQMLPAAAICQAGKKSSESTGKASGA